ncbi:MAG: DNA polymerase III [Treponema sp.]|nr:DNA polymerase III [Treponema sp.]
MFENIIEQAAALQLKDDILSRRLAPSILLFGPAASGKGSAALELARVNSCADGASWKCSCPDCERHRHLLHSDLLILGPRNFSAEISASASAFLREPSVAAVKTLFIRSLRKLMARFSPVLMEDDPKAGKLSPLLQSLEEGLNEIDASGKDADNGALEKLCNALAEKALKLESEGISDTIPVAHIRQAAWWCRLAPAGRRKTLLIENADRMKEASGNSLLKLLEEPPATVTIILTALRSETLMPTILSRLRPYRFVNRSQIKEKEVIRRVFRDSAEDRMEAGFSGGGLISVYLNSFLVRSDEKLYPRAAFFLASLARAVFVSLKRKGAAGIPAPITALGERYSPISDAAGYARITRMPEVVRTLLSESSGLEKKSFSRFLGIGMNMVSQAFRDYNEDTDKPEKPVFIAYRDIFRKYFHEAQTSVNVLNQNPAMAMETLFFRLEEALARGQA